MEGPVSPARAPGANGRNTGTLWHDFLASVVVFLVALPLCMGIALASGVPAEKAAAVGIITGVIGGLVVGLIGGSPLQVSGPAAGLSVIVFDLIQTYGWERLGLIVALAGLVQFVAGIARLGQWFRAVSPAVIHGMLAGIGVLIFASQFHVMVDDTPKGSGLQNLLSIPEAVYKGVFPNGEAPHYLAARVGLLTIVILAGWRVLAPRRLRVVPAALVAVVLATVVTAAMALPIRTVEVPANVFAALSGPSLTGLETWAAWKGIVLAALAVAFIASAETLLTATAVDKMHAGPRARYDRELAAQGVGNTLSGLLGGLPMTGVIVRSATNVQAGARSRWSAVMHGLWLLVFVGFFAGLLRYIPTASLAALLVYTGYKLVNVTAVRALWQFGRSEVLIYGVTVATIVAADLLTGVLTGIALSALKLLYTFSHLRVRLDDDPAARRAVLHLEGTACFLRLPKLAAALEQVPPDRELHVHFEHLNYIDHACLDLLMGWEQQHRATGGSLVLDWNELTARFRQPRNGAAPPAEKARPKGDVPALSGAGR